MYLVEQLGNCVYATELGCGFVCLKLISVVASQIHRWE